MRIIYLTDIHDAVDPLRRVMSVTNADIYLIAGDLIYSIFPSYSTAWDFIELQEYFQGIKGRDGLEGNLYQVAKEIAGREGVSAEEQRRAEKYIKLCLKAERLLASKYERIEEIFGRSGDRKSVV
jgi:hypothetical protein